MSLWLEKQLAATIPNNFCLYSATAASFGGEELVYLRETNIVPNSPSPLERLIHTRGEQADLKSRGEPAVVSLLPTVGRIHDTQNGCWVMTFQISFVLSVASTR
jgi:hypothetical protein